MRVGLAISALLHVALLMWALISIEATPKLKDPKPDPIVADIVTPAELAQMRKGAREAKLDNARRLVGATA